MKIAVVDGQGGGIGRSIIERIKKTGLDNTEILAIGTNAKATASMIKAGADKGATGENALITNVTRMDVILGPIAVLIPNAIMGEITSEMTISIGTAEALKILIPLNQCQVKIPGTKQHTLAELLDSAMDELKIYVENKMEFQKKYSELKQII